MKFSANWLKELSGVTWNDDVLAEHFAELGFPVADVTRTGVSIKNIVSAKILSVEKHPNADKLSVTQVTDGTTTRTVVCGANNIAAGQVVPLARPGTKFPNGMEIAIAKLRGVESHGMLCSSRELGISDEHAGIYQLSTDTKLGVEMSKVLEGDSIFDLEIPPNRPDVLNHVGMARELAALAGKKIKSPALSWKAALKGDACKIENREPRLCTRYMGKLIHGVKMGPSPAWMAKRLTACGIRPINNIVDVTNYVLLEWGHPLHAFDVAKLKGGQIVVRRAKEGEKIEALDGKNYTLKNEDLVIADHEAPVAIAGIMGGQQSGVSDSTTDILLESAVFNSSIVRTTSKRLGLKSESSLRFEKGTTSETAALASIRAAQLILEVAGGRIGKAQDSYPKKAAPAKIEIQLPRMKRLIGADIKDAAVEKILTGLGYGIVKEKNKWRVTKPSYRLDVAEEADIAEDVLRFFGYNNIPARLGAFRVAEVPAVFSYPQNKNVSETLKGWGFNESLTNSMVSASLCETFGVSADRLVQLANPLSKEETALRPLLLPNLAAAVQRNINHQRDSVFLFEIGSRHNLNRGDKQPVEDRAVALIAYGELSSKEWNTPAQDVDFFFLKGVVENLNRTLGLGYEIRAEQGQSFLHPHQSFAIHQKGVSIGWGGLLHPEIAKKFDMKKPCVLAEIRLDAAKEVVPQFKEFSRIPFVERDIAMVVDKEIAWSRLAGIVKEAGGALLKDVHPFDLFSGGSLDASKKSVAFRCRLQDEQRTLSEGDITKTVDRIKSALTERCGAQLR